MREIKFRGKSVDKGIWVYGYYLVAAGMPFISVFGKREPIPVIPETVGQYTGLKDKNGVEIYEGDIIDIHQTVNGCNLFEIVWDKTRWNAKYAVEMVKPRLYEYNFNELLDVEEDETELEIVGNIYDGVGKYD